MGQAPSSTEPIPENYPRILYVHYGQKKDEELNCTLKVTLPKKWANATLEQLQEFFVDHYNGKKPSNQLDVENHHLENADGKALRGDETIASSLKNREDIYLKEGKFTYRYKKDEKAENGENEVTEEEEETLLRCRNYGCTLKYKQSDNHETACHFHSQPPVFHDTKKGWKCCDSKMVYDWDDFEKIPKCTTGPHCSSAPQVDVDGNDSAKNATSVNTTSTTPHIAAAAPTAPPAPKSIEDYNKSNPNAATAVKSAVDMKNRKPKKAVKRDDGKAKCVNYGCQKDYFVDINNDKSCCHHKSPPVFHDSGKYWSCCPNTVKYDFEEFLKIPGCVVSKHRDGSDDVEPAQEDP